MAWNATNDLIILYRRSYSKINYYYLVKWLWILFELSTWNIFLKYCFEWNTEMKKWRYIWFNDVIRNKYHYLWICNLIWVKWCCKFISNLLWWQVSSCSVDLQIRTSNIHFITACYYFVIVQHLHINWSSGFGFVHIWFKTYISTIDVERRPKFQYCQQVLRWLKKLIYKWLQNY